MIQYRFRLLTTNSVDLTVDMLWLPLVLLLIWSAAALLLPSVVPELPIFAYWWMAAGFAIGLFISVLLLALVHAWIARWLDLPLRELRLFILGTLAGDAPELNRTPTRQAIILLGTTTLFSFLLGIALLVILFSLATPALPLSFAAIAFTLGFSNLLIAAVNLLPLNPKSGGVLPGMLLWLLPQQSARRVAAAIGTAILLLIAASGVLMYLADAPLGLFAAIWAPAVAAHILAIR